MTGPLCWLTEEKGIKQVQQKASSNVICTTYVVYGWLQQYPNIVSLTIFCGCVKAYIWDSSQLANLDLNYTDTVIRIIVSTKLLKSLMEQNTTWKQNTWDLSCVCRWVNWWTRSLKILICEHQVRKLFIHSQTTSH